MRLGPQKRQKGHRANLSAGSSLDRPRVLRQFSLFEPAWEPGGPAQARAVRPSRASQPAVDVEGERVAAVLGSSVSADRRDSRAPAGVSRCARGALHGRTATISPTASSWSLRTTGRTTAATPVGPVGQPRQRASSAASAGWWPGRCRRAPLRRGRVRRAATRNRRLRRRLLRSHRVALYITVSGSPAPWIGTGWARIGGRYARLELRQSREGARQGRDRRRVDHDAAAVDARAISATAQPAASAVAAGAACWAGWWAAR